MDPITAENLRLLSERIDRLESLTGQTVLDRPHPKTPFPEQYVNLYPVGSGNSGSMQPTVIRCERARAEDALGMVRIFGTIENPQIETVWTP